LQDPARAEADELRDGKDAPKCFEWQVVAVQARIVRYKSIMIQAEQNQRGDPHAGSRAGSNFG
jgi:hypothetical protein